MFFYQPTVRCSSILLLGCPLVSSFVINFDVSLSFYPPTSSNIFPSQAKTTRTLSTTTFATHLRCGKAQTTSVSHAFSGKNKFKSNNRLKGYMRSMLHPEKENHDGDDSASAQSIPSQEMINDARSNFVQWAKGSAIPILSLNPNDNTNQDLQTIIDSILDTNNGSSLPRVLALSEGYHNCSEMMSFHHRMIRYLVEKCGYNTIVTESGLPESRIIHDYIRGRNLRNDMTKDDIFRNGLNKMYSEWKEGQDLIEWLRSYNLSQNENEVHYYGLDIGGFYSNWKRPIEERVLQYLRQVVDPEYSQQLSIQLEPYLEAMRENARVNYSERLSPRERDRLAAILREAVEHFLVNKDKYVERSTHAEYEWAKQSLVSMQMAENYYQNYLDRSGDLTYNRKYVGLTGREIAMHSNLMWILQTMRPDAKVILISHVVHNKTQTQYQDKTWGFFTPAGEMIRQSIGKKDFYIIGMVYGSGEYWKKWQQPSKRFIAPIQAFKENGLEQTLALVERKRCFVPWSKAPLVTCWAWLFSECSMRENDYYIWIKPVEWDSCVYFENTNPATPAYTHECV